MMRVKDITPITQPDSDRQNIAKFLCIDYNDITPHEAPNTYTVNIAENVDAQKAYKTRNPFGNGRIPNSWNFADDILVRWQENKLQAM